MAGWDTLDHLIREEIIQRGEEGCDVSGFAERAARSGQDTTTLTQIYDDLMTLPIRPDFSYDEPDTLEAIRAARPAAPAPLTLHNDIVHLQDQFQGAWFGRCAGCTLGKPLEYEPFMSGNTDAPGWQHIQRWFEGADAWPIHGYVPQHSRAEAQGIGLAAWGGPTTREHLTCMVSDDDIRYTVLGLLLMETQGLKWDSWDVGKLWHRYLTYQQVCTAETQAYLNFAQVTSHLHGEKPANWPERQVWVRTYLNPYREWIGAQIRVDGLAYAAAGNPELAAELAYRDASLSHSKNGVYGAMFVAAMIAAAFAKVDERQLVEIGLSQIPANSRLSEAIRKAVTIAESASDAVELVRRIWDSFQQYNAVHTINNAALVAAALVFSKGDFETAITTAVLGGWDTDCNGATVGSIMGAKLGAARLPEQWLKPLNDTLYAEVNGFHPISITECAYRSYVTFQRTQKTLISGAEQG